MGLEALFQRAAREHWKKTAVVCNRTRISYGCLEVRSTQVAGMLRNMLDPGEKKVLLLAHNSILCLEALLGCLKAGVTACPVNWRLSPYELSTLLIQERFGLIFYDRDTWGLLQQSLDLCDFQIPRMRLGGLKYQSCVQVFAYDRPVIDEKRGIDEIAIQYFTSGSTGVPKGVLHTHRSMIQYLRAYSTASGWPENGVYQTSANLFHLSGFSALISLCLGNKLVLMDHFQMEEFLQAMKEEKVTRVSVVPTLLTKMLEDGRLSSFRTERLVYAGSAMAPSQIQRALEHLPCTLEMAYGSTETCCISMLTETDHRAVAEGRLDRRKLASVGRPLPEVSVRLEDSQGGEPLLGGIGEILVKSPFLYQGYSGSHVQQSLTQDGYHRTGDIGRWDEDGYLYIVDRKHDMIVCGGENIYPREVEICIAKMINCVQAVGVVGEPDPVWGERVAAFVVPKAGTHPSAEDIIAFCKHNIASYKKPSRVIFVDALPLDGNGKVSKRALRELLNEGISDPSQ